MASEVGTAIVERSAAKQRLRAWVGQLQQGAGADPKVRETLQRDMLRPLEWLQRLSVAAIAFNDDGATRSGHLRR